MELCVLPYYCGVMILIERMNLPVKMLWHTGLEFIRCPSATGILFQSPNFLVFVCSKYVHTCQTRGVKLQLYLCIIRWTQSHTLHGYYSCQEFVNPAYKRSLDVTLNYGKRWCHDTLEVRDQSCILVHVHVHASAWKLKCPLILYSWCFDNI